MPIDYSSQSPTSDPGERANLFDALPADARAVSTIVQGLLYHYMSGVHFFGHQPPPERIPEVDTRTIARILDRLVELDPRPLVQSRSFEDRVLGSCRDFSLLACAILRHHGVPARLRYGFSAYFDPGWFLDHVIVEMWDGGRWVRFDPQFAGVLDTNVDLLDLPHDAFVTGGRAWQLCRDGADPSRFGLGPNVPEISGTWLVRGRMQLDLAAVRKQELLCWDEWGYGTEDAELSREDEALLDRIAAAEDGDADEWLALAELVAPLATVNCYSPAVGPHDVLV